MIQDFSGVEKASFGFLSQIDKSGEIYDVLEVPTLYIYLFKG
jgi:hypothetical protein